jgi:hypothetical protein
MTVVALILVGLFVRYIYRNYWGRILAAKWYGTETDATVSRIERNVLRFRGEEYPVYNCYVCFLRQDGLENEAKLLNPKKNLAPGSRIRVRYLPEKIDVAVMRRQGK